MAFSESAKINTSPKTESQLRAALWQSQAQLDELRDDFTVLNTQVGPVSATFDSATVAGQPVYVSGAGTVELAQANATATSGVVGLAWEAVAAAGSGSYITAGLITVADWTAIIGSASLTPGLVYFLSAANAGQLTATAPTTDGQTVVPVGRALTATTLLLDPKVSVLL